MTQLLELKTSKSAEISPLATAFGAESPITPILGEATNEPQWEVAKKGAKPEATAFDDSLDPKRYMDWETGLEEYFEWYQLPEGRRIQFAQMKLTGQARIYWRNLQATRERRHDPAITTWAEMKSRLREKYIPACYRPMIIDEWQRLRQEEGTVVDYVARFDDLMIRCNVDEEPLATLARFRAGLRLEFQRELILQEISTLEKAYRYTLNMELYATHAHKNHSPWVATPEIARYAPSAPRNSLPITLPTTPQNTPPTARLSLPSPTNPPPTTAPLAGSRLGPPLGLTSTRGSVPSANDPSPGGRFLGGTRPRPPNTFSNNSGNRVACYKCQGWGHFASQCPSPRQTTRPARALLVEIQVDAYSPPVVDDESLAEIYEADPELAQAFEGNPATLGCIIKELKPLTDEEHTLADSAPLGTTLSEIPKGENSEPEYEDPIRSSIFSTFSRIGSTVIKILVDSGSVVNAVAAASVLALDLHPRPHPRPYKAMWINETYLAVTKRCVVPLKVAGYHEDIWCDILPMGVGSVLLGRPWLYDRDVAQLGRANHCIFFFEGRKQVWQPYISST